ncbi:hypothetical protein IEQ34_023422 [Dendrobium chrysotoxum]|nr:hypothetical protein IEQ34_026040 [Dendrobium chrysotoxum]KAH0439619.1 hypothetical protein IEQ34_025902 [Dendrobium chrysotoxum]KAH0445586.1 hypothetical protein IEQ34_025352 [Dendrobium chrysotoxum]KAH0445968.1 hypothetical protein IEQ34_025198 [Dendrobium chrysotoxum]KAH0446154.1 hypothetical protein IEQ34_025015 [Dendrobium chrysotoxum]
MYRTANPGMTVRPRPWPRGVGSSTELFSVKGSFGFLAELAYASIYLLLLYLSCSFKVAPSFFATHLFSRCFPNWLADASFPLFPFF